MRLDDLVQTSRRVAETGGRLAKIELLATLLRRAAPEEIPIAIAFLSGSPRQGRIGVGYAALAAARSERAADAPALELGGGDTLLDRLAPPPGKGSSPPKGRLLGDLFARATSEKQGVLFPLLI